MYIGGPSCKVPDILDRFLKYAEIRIFVKICAVGAELLQTDRWTDGQTGITKLIVTFHKFANVPKKLTA
jgi:hypothetical protein